jgi:pilus assembly protein Flp/PilA
MFSKINEAIMRLLVLARNEEGQALAEYGLILGLIAVVCIIALGVLGTAISGQLGSIAGALPGGGAASP